MAPNSDERSARSPLTRRFSAPRRAPGLALAIASLVVAVCAWAVVHAIEAGVDSHRTTTRTREVRLVLANAHGLLAAHERRAAAAATSLAAARAVQDAFARRDVAALTALAAAHPHTGFVLWNGNAIGSGIGQEPQASVDVYGGSGRIGQVIAADPPGAAALARLRSGAVRVVYVVAGRVVASSPSLRPSDFPGVLHGTISDSVRISGTRANPTIYAYASKPGLPGEDVWPLLIAVAAGIGFYTLSRRRQEHRRSEPPPSHVRDAVALVGETLAATHNPRALLPVILRASVEATGAAGGKIEQEGGLLASRGGPSAAAETIEIPLDVDERSPATMTLFAPAGGFRPDAHDAALWIGSQALIALENARLHGLVQRQAVTDELTGLANRRRFLTALETEIGRSQRSGSPLAVVLADLDDFKLVNDTWGHEVGDEALRSFASVLRLTVRDIDLPVRLGGEEFAILLPDTDLDGATQLAERVRHAVAVTRIQTATAQFNITASFGVSCFPTAAGADNVLTDADRRLYDAKRQGKNRVCSSHALRGAPFGD